MKYARAYVDRTRTADDDPDAPIHVVASTSGRKADGLDLVIEGVDLDRFLRNPVILWAHDHRTRPPIGRAPDTRVEDGKLVSALEFDPADEFARGVSRKYRTGFLSAVSIGFDFEYDAWDPETGRVEAWELHEISGVPVPMDADALKVGRCASCAAAETGAGGRLTETADDDLVERLTALGFVRAPTPTPETDALRDLLAAFTTPHLEENLS